MPKTLRTRGHRIPTAAVRVGCAAMVGALVFALVLESRIAALATMLALAGFAGWVGSGETSYEVTDDALKLRAALSHTTVRKTDVRRVTWERDELSIEELTIHGEQGRAISVPRAELVRHPDFARQLGVFLDFDATLQALIAQNATATSADLLALAG